MTKEAVEFIVEACERYDGIAMGTEAAMHREVARLAVRMAVAWEEYQRDPRRFHSDEFYALPKELSRLIEFNAERGTLDRPTWPEKEGPGRV